MYNDVYFFTICVYFVSVGSLTCWKNVRRTDFYKRYTYVYREIKEIDMYM